MNHYKVLLSSLSDLAVDGKDKSDVNDRFSLVSNTICLAAPENIVTALMRFQSALKMIIMAASPNRSYLGSCLRRFAQMLRLSAWTSDTLNRYLPLAMIKVSLVNKQAEITLGLVKW